MIWQSTIDLTDDERAQLNVFAKQYEGSSEETVPNVLRQFPSVLEKISNLIDSYLPKKYKKYLVQSWAINVAKDTVITSNPHNHGYSHFNFIFYTQSNGENSLVLRDANNLEFKLKLKTNDFIILPPQQIHMIEIGKIVADRISFVGDIILTEVEYKSSMFLPPMNVWQELE